MDDIESWFRKGLDHIWLPYAQMKTQPDPAPISSTEGARLNMADGTTLIDGVGSWWTSVHGYNHPALLKAAHEQLETMPHIMLGGLAHEQAYRLASRLSQVTPGDLCRTFFTESGSVAVEVAMKVAVQYAMNRTGARRTRFVSFKGGYHGDTFATMSVCDPEEGMHSLFAGVVPEQYVVDLPDTDDRAAALDRLLSGHDDIAAVIVEPLIQGAGGMHMHSPETLKALREVCDRHGVLLIFDEIFTGFGRTGEIFAADRAGVTPDILCLGKALTGGVTPLAATIASRKVYDAFHTDSPEYALMHGPTFTGHAIGCAVANAGLDLFENEPRLEQVRAIERQLLDELAPLSSQPGVADVRICGAVAAVEFEKDFNVNAARSWFIERGTFIRPLGTVVYLTPAYVIEAADLSSLTNAVSEFAESRVV
ncbi:adenosylmethionine--8-amino-7-oxononanoate transaminase [Henriciella aquimarina]|uniref:adenosylmethionine--8-amino-7-oxononanoate transaminase n=1 Tax=Henriciella aquimarina TaxID=545261 RepID=UPI0009FF214C|nr:adenosylmethionine--8-amino-7-oxononanoate transaminase [Henriciella aquimarina]